MKSEESTSWIGSPPTVTVVLVEVLIFVRLVFFLFTLNPTPREVVVSLVVFLVLHLVGVV